MSGPKKSDMQRSVHGEVISSTSTSPRPDTCRCGHGHREGEAPRRVQKNVVICSIPSQLAGHTTRSSLPRQILGRHRLECVAKAKAILRLARNIERVARSRNRYALIDTGSRMDDVIFEGSGHGNLEINLAEADRKAYFLRSHQQVRYSQGKLLLRHPISTVSSCAQGAI